ncbi:MAG: hypothetical protein ABIF71_07830 [Planctomycetota bacterium]
MPMCDICGKIVADVGFDSARGKHLCISCKFGTGEFHTKRVTRGDSEAAPAARTPAAQVVPFRSAGAAAPGTHGKTAPAHAGPAQPVHQRGQPQQFQPGFAAQPQQPRQPKQNPTAHWQEPAADPALAPADPVPYRAQAGTIRHLTPHSLEPEQAGPLEGSLDQTATPPQTMAHQKIREQAAAVPILIALDVVVGGLPTHIFYPSSILSFSPGGVCIDWRHCTNCPGYTENGIHPFCIFSPYSVNNPKAKEMSVRVNIANLDARIEFKGQVVYTLKKRETEFVGIAFAKIAPEALNALERICASLATAAQ